jgi:hypothetical protein
MTIREYDLPDALPISKNQLDLLTKPSVILFVTGDDESRCAIDELDRAGVWFSVRPSQVKSVVAEWRDLEIAYSGLEGIRQLAKIIAGLNRPTTPTPGQVNSLSHEQQEQIKRSIAARRRQQREQALAEFERVQHSKGNVAFA